MTAIDYRDLLHRYIQLVLDEEGIDFLRWAREGEPKCQIDVRRNIRTGEAFIYRSIPRFTAEEIIELNNLAVPSPEEQSALK